jgi:hypothetical protein
MERFLRLLLVLALALLAAGLAAAQSWNGGEGSSILRVSPIGFNDPYEHARLYFLGRPAKLLAPPYSYVYPFGAATGGEGRITRDFHPLDRSGRDTYAEHAAAQRVAQAQYRKHKGGAR